MLVPEGSTSTYILTVQTPIDNNLPKFQLCKISIKRVGGNMPCVIPDDSTVSYESTVAATHADKGTLSLGSISDLPISPGNATENTITFEIIVTPLQHTAITQSSSHDVTMTITYGSGATVSSTSTFTVQSTTAAADISVSYKIIVTNSIVFVFQMQSIMEILLENCFYLIFFITFRDWFICKTITSIINCIPVTLCCPYNGFLHCHIGERFG